MNKHDSCHDVLIRIEEKLTQIEEKVETNNKNIATRATVAGGVSGAIFSVGIALIKAKLGLGG